MEDFFARVESRRHAWPPGRRDLHWLVVPGAEVARPHLYEPYRALAEMPGLYPVQPEWMHVTLLHMGPEESASTREIDQLAAAVAERAAGMAPYDLTLSRPDIGTVAIESRGFPGAPHRALCDMTWEATRAVVGDRWPRIPTISYPHLSHAYAGANGHLADRTELKVALSDLPGGPVTLPVTTLSLVAEWHDRREIRWDVLAEVPLSNGRH